MTKQAPADKKAPNRSIFVTILRSMLAVLLVELVLLIGILYFSRVNVQLEQNAADLLQKQVENRQSYLQSLMLSAQDLSTLAGSINTTAQSLIDSGDISVDTLDRSNEDALPLLSAIGEKMIASMRRCSVTGIFVVLNTHDLDTRTEGDPLPCLYLRDLEPSSSPLADRAVAAHLDRYVLDALAALFRNACGRPALPGLSGRLPQRRRA